MKQLVFYTLIFLTAFSCKQDKGGANSTTMPAPGESPVMSISLDEVWSTPSSLLVTPESVRFDEELGVYYISCIGGVPPTEEDGDGYIAILDQRGNIINEKWVDGLDAPKGMDIVGDFLYVTDINEFVIIDRKQGVIVEKIPVENSVFLNDVTAAPNGTVYFSDMSTNIIYAYEHDSVSIYLHSEQLGGVNGLYADHETMTCAASDGSVNTIDIATKKITKKAKGIMSGDGIEPWKGGFIVSNWNGEVWYISSTWQETKVMDTKDQKINTADITVNQKTGQLLIPTFFDNRVVAFDIH